MPPKIRINHGSVYAHDPQRAAEHLAALSGGLARSFHPCEGAWLCFLTGDDQDWDGPLLEFYPHSVTLASDGGRLVFRKTKLTPRGAGTHFNLTITKSRKAIEKLCAERALTCSGRDWQGLLEVWIEEDLLVECVPA
jgi:hypothetical protein